MRLHLHIRQYEEKTPRLVVRNVFSLMFCHVPFIVNRRRVVKWIGSFAFIAHAGKY